jgi:histone-lysine N-methyltransferase SETMAR
MSTQTPEIHLFGFTALDHPPYSPNLALSDFHLFPKLKEHLRGHYFLADKVKTAVKTWFHQQEAQFYHHGFMKLPEH